MKNIVEFVFPPCSTSPDKVLFNTVAYAVVQFLIFFVFVYGNMDDDDYRVLSKGK